MPMNKVKDIWRPCLALGFACGVVACERAERPPLRPKAALPAGSAPATPGAAPSPPDTAAIASSAGALPGTLPPAAGPVSGSDRAFVAEAASAGMAEIEAGRFMAGKASNARIREYAQQMERDHAGANDELQRIAAGKGIALPSAAQGPDRKQVERLMQQPAARLESEFLQSFGVDAHARAVALFERQARDGQDPELRAFAERTLARLREHLGMARQLQGREAGSR